MKKQLIPEIPQLLEKDQTNALLNIVNLDIPVCNNAWIGNTIFCRIHAPLPNTRASPNRRAPPNFWITYPRT